MGHLTERGLDNNTLVIYVTDNGWIQHPMKNGYAPRSKQTPYEGGVRTPIMYRWRGKFQPDTRDDLVSSIDIVPTILAAAQIEPAKNLPGLNLMQNLTGQIPIDRETIFGEGFAHDIADLDDPEASLLYRWCIQGKWKLILTYDGEINRYQTTHPRNIRRPQLYDLISDPEELNNLAISNPEVVQRLVNRINQWYEVKQSTLTK